LGAFLALTCFVEIAKKTSASRFGDRAKVDRECPLS
jgi:hypothetical protein